MNFKERIGQTLNQKSDRVPAACAAIRAMFPVKISCEGIELKPLKKGYGNDIAFWGGCAVREYE